MDDKEYGEEEDEDGEEGRENDDENEEDDEKENQEEEDDYEVEFDEDDTEFYERLEKMELKKENPFGTDTFTFDDKDLTTPKEANTFDFNKEVKLQF